MLPESFYEEISSESPKKIGNKESDEMSVDLFAPIYIEMNKIDEAFNELSHQNGTDSAESHLNCTSVNADCSKDLNLYKASGKSYLNTPQSSLKAHHRSISSNSSVSSNSMSSNSEERKQFQIYKSKMEKRSKQNYLRNTSREDETVYTEIVTRKKAMEKTNSRITRQSENIILREDFDENVTITRRAKSLHDLSCVKKRSFNELNSSTKSQGKNSRQRHMQPRCKKQNYHRGSLQIENNTNILDYANLQGFSPTKAKKYERKHGCKRDSIYSNIIKRDKLYENFSDDEDYEEDYYGGESRNRSTSQPINIIQPENNEQLHYSHIDFNRVSNSSLQTGSPISSRCSSHSSEVSSFASNSLSPSYTNKSRKRATRYSTWTNISSYEGLNYYPAHYLGNMIVSKVTKESVESAVSNVAQNTNVLEMKPVYVEVTNEFIRFGTAVMSWELLVSFAIDEVVSFEVVLKNAYFFGIIVCKTGHEARCYVLHTEKANEIYDTIMDVFRTTPKVSNSKSLHDLQYDLIQPEFHRFHYIVNIGSVVVKKCFPNVNEYIEIALEKINPKDYRNVNLEVLGSNILVIDTTTGEEQSHYISWILSLGVFSKDGRYFGYILSKSGMNGKTKCLCHVYRASRNNSATQVVEAISLSFQKTYSPKEISQVSPVYSETYSAFHGSSFSSNNSHPRSINNVTVEVSDLCNKKDKCVDETIHLNDRFSKIDQSPHLMNKGEATTQETSFIASGHQLKPLERLDSGIGDQTSLSYIEYCTDQNLSSSAETKKECKKKFPTKIMEKFRRSIILTNESPTTSTETYNETVSFKKSQPKEYKFLVKYICSTIINPPLKLKHIRKCYKQFHKEMAKGVKQGSNSMKHIEGCSVSLEMNIKGIIMTDPNQNGYTIRTFSLESLEQILTHPDGLECFGFTTSDPAQKCKHKMHLFSAPLACLTDIKNAFESLNV